MHSFSKKAALIAGWNLFLTRPFFLVGVVLLVTAVSMVSDMIVQSLTVSTGVLFALNVLAFVINTILSMGVLLTALRVHDGVETGFLDLLEPVPLFWKYVLATLFSGILFVIGLIFFIIPGILIELAFSMALYAVIDKELGPIAALAHSYQITRGHRLNIFLFLVSLLVLNAVGLMLFGFGLLLTVPMSLLSLVWVYRWLHSEKNKDTAILSAWSWITAVGVFLGGLTAVALFVLSSVFVQSDTDARSARDAQRGVAIEQTQIALETYNDLIGVYPVSLHDLVPEYLYQLPVDPKTNQVFSYTVLDLGADYELCAMFETGEGSLMCVYASDVRQQEFEQFDFSE